MTINPETIYPSMKKIDPHTNYAGVTDLTKPKATPPAPKTGVVGASAQTLKPGHDKDGKLLNPVAPAGAVNEQASAMYPSMVPAYKVGVTPGYEHLKVDPTAQGEFIKLAQSMGLTQAQAQQLVDFHVRITFDKAGG